jgi:hypothetical protein
MRKIWEQMTKADTWEARHAQWLQKQERKRIANRPAAKDARFVVNRMRRGLAVPNAMERDKRRSEAQERKQREREAFRTLRQLGMRAP